MQNSKVFFSTQRLYRILFLAVFFHISPSHSVAQSYKLTREVAELVEGGDFAKAEIIARKQRIAEPFIAWLMIKQGKEKEGLSLLESSMGLKLDGTDSRDTLLEAVLITGDASAELGINVLESYLEEKSIAGNVSFWLKLLQLYSATAHPEKGEGIADKVLDLNPAPDVLLTPLFEYAVSLYAHDQPEMALLYYRKLLNRVPKSLIDPGYQLQYAHILNATKQSLDALAIVDEIKSNFPDYAVQNKPLLAIASAQAFENLGDIQASRKQYEQIIEHGNNPHLARIAKDKIRNFSEDEQARNLQATNINQDQVDALTSKPKRPLSYMAILIFNLVLITSLLVYFRYRKLKGA